MLKQASFITFVEISRCYRENHAYLSICIKADKNFAVL